MSWHWTVVCVCGVCVLCMCGVLTDGGCSADSAADARHALVRLATCKYPLRALAWLGLARLAALPPLIHHLYQLWPVLHTHAFYLSLCLSIGDGSFMFGCQIVGPRSLETMPRCGNHLASIHSERRLKQRVETLRSR